jgi:hypothetical protein
MNIQMRIKQKLSLISDISFVVGIISILIVSDYGNISELYTARGILIILFSRFIINCLLRVC